MASDSDSSSLVVHAASDQERERLCHGLKIDYLKRAKLNRYGKLPAQQLAEVKKSCSAEELLQASWANAQRIYGITS